MKKNRKSIWVAVFAAAMLIVICALGLLCWNLFGMYTGGHDSDGLTMDIPAVSSDADTRNSDVEPSISVVSLSKPDTDSEKKSSKSSKQNTDTDKKTKSNSSSTKKQVSSEKDKPVINGDVNFTELWAINPDIYAWIKIPNTAVNYPVLQSSVDDAFYLEHNIYRQYEFAGCIYSEKINSKSFTDPNTILYGHNLLNGTMFASLHNFRDPDFFANNEYIYILLPDSTLVYQIFSAYEYDDRHLMYSFNFNDKNEFAHYLEYATNPTNSMTYNIRDINVTADDTIITLSTCMDAIATSRYLVQGVLVSNEPVE